MKPVRFVEARDQSVPATCTHTDRPWFNPIGVRCGALMQLVFTKSPLSTMPYDELVITRCLAGHIERGGGVIPEVSPVNNDADDDGA
jgi:hypothetical protein